MNLGFDPRYVGLLSPADLGGSAASSDVIGLKEVLDMDILVYFGAITGDTIAVTVSECDDTTPTNSTAIAFQYRKGAAVGTDTDGAVAAATTSGVTMAATDDDKVLTIGIDPAALTSGYPYVRVTITPGGSASACEVAVIAVAKPRYKSTTNLSLVD